jgi:photosystem II stability/assembly factor-like uncharacterized protein
MRTVFKIMVLLISVSAAYAQGGWHQVPSGTTTNLLGMLNSVDYLNRIWVLGENGLILVSSDGGSTFGPQSSPTSNDLYDMEIIEQEDGGNCAVGENGTIIKTTDLGLSWNVINSGVTHTLRAIMDPVIVGDSGTLLVSTTGGNSWSRKIPPVIENFNDVLSDFSWIIIVGNNGTILRYNVGTNVWAVLSSGTSVHLRSVHNMHKIVGGFTYAGYVVVGDNGVVLTSTNLGANWTMESSGTNIMLNAAFETGNFNSEIIWSCGEQGKIFYSLNDGIAWNSAVSPVTAKLNNISFGTPQHGVPAFTGFIVGDGGVILRTFNFGLTGLNMISNTVPSEYSLHQNYPNPFNPVTKIKFKIPYAGFINLKIFDILGRELSTLINQQLNPGTYEMNWNASEHPSGVYYYRIAIHSDKLSAGSFTDTKKMILIK